MSAKWSSQVLGKSGTPDFGALLKDEFTVALLRGKNVFGDLIYCYVKIALPNVSQLEAALQSDASFDPSDFGTVVAAGKGEPPDEVKNEITSLYSVFNKPKPTESSGSASGGGAMPPEEKKAWDEY